MNLKATNKTETNKYELEVEISAEDFNKALSEVAKTEGKKMSVPGFRKGHAPRSVIEKMYGENAAPAPSEETKKASYTDSWF